MSYSQPLRFSNTARSIALAAIVLLGFAGTLLAAPPVLIYNSIPSPLPPNVPSVGFDASGYRQFGDHIKFAGTNRTLSNVTLTMSDWADPALYPSFPGAGGPTWNWPITLNIFAVDNSGPNPQPGALIATRTVTLAIPWRPAADPTCPSPPQWRAGDGNCYGGIAFTGTFDFTGVVVPNEIIYGVAYNTHAYGYTPVGTKGPYDALNVGLAKVPPTTGSNPDPDSAYLDSTLGAAYADGGTGGTGIFRRDTGWTPYSVAASFATEDADLSVTKVASAGPYGTGLPITYTITVANGGATGASNVVVADTLPAGMTFVSATPSQGSCNSSSPVSCSLGTVAASGSATITLKATLPATPGPVTNTATVSSDTPDSNPGNNSGSATVTVIPSQNIPTLSPISLMFLSLMLTAAGFVAMRRY
ncbi:MAG TPA: IPTL-CTERM sorting domain-containing protein [Vicinamibacterales bacterium]